MSGLTDLGRLRLPLAALVAVACVVGGYIALDDHDPARAKTVTPVGAEEDVVVSHDDTTPVSTAPVKARKLRAGEKRKTLQIPTAYQPTSPTGQGDDDYRCFLLDPDLPEDAWLTGTQILPGNPEIVHHVILFRVTEDRVADAQALDAESPEPGWTCFGGMGIGGEFANIDDAAWLGAWAPGGRETVSEKGYGKSLEQGTQIVMQVHYNLLLGDGPDQSATQIRWTPKAGSDIQSVHTVLLPAPVEMPCRAQHALGALCDREASIADAKLRFGEDAGNLANLLHLVCGSQPEPTDTMSCTKGMPHSMTVLAASGHMHLLGRWLKITANPGKPDEKVLLDIPLWNFDDQGAVRIDPVHIDRFDQINITCHHSQKLRDLLPQYQGTQEKYVVWGEGTTDEMCLGILQVVFDEDVPA